MAVLGDDHAYDQCVRKRAYRTKEAAEAEARRMNREKGGPIQAQAYDCHFLPGDHWHVGRPATLKKMLGL
jgi:hypothetical protein